MDPDPIILWEKLRGLRQLSVSGLRRTNEELSDRVNNLMKRLLNDPVMNDTGWPINKKVKQETDVRNDSKNISPKWHLSCYQHRTLKRLIYNGPTYDNKGQTKCFSSRSLLSLPSLSSKCVTDQFRTPLAKRPKNWVWACLHCLPTR